MAERDQPIPNQQVGHYQILSRLGEGGMGVVYRAKDTRLGRTIALKFLNSTLTKNPEALERFQLEARATSALDHPNICSVYDIGEHEGQPFIAMQYLVGQTLMQKLAHGPVTTEELIDFGTQIAGAFVAAHAKGIIHRDIKPANVFLTESGAIKILDFGLAKLIQAPEQFRSAASTEQPPDPHLTSPGIAIGTLAYMSPEQALGKELDTRTDLFSLGVLLYQMATGSLPFRGETFAALSDEILHRTPPSPLRTNPDLPIGLEHIIDKALEKDKELRYQSASEILSDVKRLKRNLDSGGSTVAARKVPLRKKMTGPRTLALAALGAVAVIAIWAVFFRSNQTTDQPTAVAPEYRLTQLTWDTGLTFAPTLSADGRLLAYASDRAGEANLDIWVQQVPNGNPIRVTNHEADDNEPHFAPDGKTIVFRSEREGGGIYVIPALGGEERFLAPAGRRPRYSPDGKQVVFWTGESPYLYSVAKTFLVPANGGPANIFLPDVDASYPIWSPDSSRILFYRNHEGIDDWWIASVEGGDVKRTGAFDVFRRHGMYDTIIAEAWLEEEDRILFMRRLGDSKNIWQIRISPQDLRVTASPERLTRGSGIEGWPTAAANIVVFTSITENADIWSYPLDPDKFQVAGEPRRLTDNGARDFFPTISMDGSKLAFVSTRSGNQDIWFKDLESGKEAPLTVTPFREGGPKISPDGTLVAYRADGKDRDRAVHSIPIQKGISENVCKGCYHAWAWSSDGTELFIGRRRFPRSIRLVDVQTHERTRVVELREPGRGLGSVALSRDDRWVVFHTNNSPLTRQTFIAPYQKRRPIRPEQWIAVTDGSTMDLEQRWSSDGNAIYILSERDGFRCVWVQPLEPSTKHPLGPPKEVYHFNNARLSPRRLVMDEVGLSVTHDQFALTLTEVTGNLWMMEPVGSTSMGDGITADPMPIN